MGYGGALIYSGLARNLKQKFPKKKVIFAYPLNLDELLWHRAALDRLVWKHNEDIDMIINQLHWSLIRHRYPPAETIVINIDDPHYFYWVKNHGTWIEYKQGKHAIQIACDIHDIKNADLRPKIVLSLPEKEKVKRLLKRNNLTPGQYLCIEPHTKETFSPNKAWFWERWQELVGRLKDFTIVQIGTAGSKILDGTINLTGQTTFRETAEVLAHAKLLISAEGGLPHLAAAVGTPAVVLLSNVLPPELVAYPQNKNLYADQTCVCRGLKTPCPRGRACMAAITVDQVYRAAREVLDKPAKTKFGEPPAG